MMLSIVSIDQYDHNDTYVSNRIFNLVFNAPQPDLHKTGHAHPVLLEGEQLPHWPDHPYLDLSTSIRRTGGLVAHQQEQPDQYN